MIKEEKKDLKWFIDENYRLLTAMGVFGGLTTLFTRLEDASYLTFLSFLMFIILGIELYRKSPASGTFSMYLFQNLIITLLAVVALYLLLHYSGEFMQFFPQFIVAIISFVIISSLRAIIDWFKRHRTTAKVVRVFGYVGLSIFVIIIAIILFVLVFVLLDFLGVVSLPSP
jgi:hypothetical protein